MLKGENETLHITYDVTYLSCSVLPKPQRMCLKVEGTARSSHRSHLKQDHLALFSLWRPISTFHAFLCSSKQIPMPGLCFCKPLDRVCVFLFVPYLYHHCYYWHNLISTGFNWWTLLDMLMFLQDRAMDNKCIWPLTHLKLADYHVHPVISWSSHIPLFGRSRAIVSQSILLHTIS